VLGGYPAWEGNIEFAVFAFGGDFLRIEDLLVQTQGCVCNVMFMFLMS